MPSPKANTPCPDLAQFQRLVSAQLSDINKEAILHHLESCDACAGKIAALPEEDTLVGLIRHADTLDEATGNMINRLVERLSKLRPSESFAAAEQAPPLIFACPSCGKGLKINAAFAGKTGRCPHCKAAMRVPAASACAQGGAQPVGDSVAQQSFLTGPHGLSNDSPSGESKAAGKVFASSAHQHVKEKNQEYDFLAPPQTPDEMGRLGPYRVLQVLGAGSMGAACRSAARSWTRSNSPWPARSATSAPAPGATCTANASAA
jgi:hypothetical protein